MVAGLLACKGDFNEIALEKARSGTLTCQHGSKAAKGSSAPPANNKKNVGVLDPETGPVGAPGGKAADLALIIPTFNERDNIAELVKRFDETLAGIAWEAIFVDDDSTDGTLAELKRLARADSRIRF